MHCSRQSMSLASVESSAMTVVCRSSRSKYSAKTADSHQLAELRTRARCRPRLKPCPEWAQDLRESTVPSQRCTEGRVSFGTHFIAMSDHSQVDTSRLASVCAPRVASWCPCTFLFVRTPRFPRGSHPQVWSLRGERVEASLPPPFTQHTFCFAASTSPHGVCPWTRPRPHNRS